VAESASRANVARLVSPSARHWNYVIREYGASNPAVITNPDPTLDQTLPRWSNNPFAVVPHVFASALRFHRHDEISSFGVDRRILTDIMHPCQPPRRGEAGGEES